MKTRPVLVLGMALLLGLAGCGGGGGRGGGSPGDPVAPLPTVAMEMLLRNADGQATFQRLSLFFDETRLGGGSTGNASSTSPPMHATATAAPGRHTIRAVIEEQTVSPSVYVLSGTIQYGGRTIDVASTRTSVATGGSVSVDFDL